MNYSGKHALVLGLGESGLAMARWLLHSGAEVRVADTREEHEVEDRLAILKAISSQVTFVGGQHFKADLLNGIDFVAVSPGLVPHLDLNELIPAAEEKSIPLWGEIELFAQALAVLKETQAYHPFVMAITGTNGKTTVTSLTGMLCERAGLTTKVAGNISPAALDVLRECIDTNTLPQAWVLELSSFQLHWTYSLNANVATLLNLTQDHLEWHGSMEAYAADKARIFGKDTVRILNRDDALTMQFATTEPKTITFGMDVPTQANDFGVSRGQDMQWLLQAVPHEEIITGKQKALIDDAFTVKQLMPANALKIRGMHNVMNALAALALCRVIGLPLASLLHSLRDYRGEPHRVELIAVVQGVEYYDDSKGTNVGATVAALNGLGHGGAQRFYLIAGGLGKGQDFTPLVMPLKQYAKKVLLMGRDAPVIREDIADSQVATETYETLEAAVNSAAADAKEGDIVLLSPACASFDMFKGYAHRSKVFIDAVREVALSKGEDIQ